MPAYSADLGNGTAREHTAHHREHDLRLVTALARSNFEGSAFDVFNEELIKYGYRVSVAWISSGRMQVECRLRGRQVGLLPAEAAEQDRIDLAIDTAVEGAVLFRQVALVGGRWSPHGGASLTTYYIGACVQAYPNVYRRWEKHHHRWLVVQPTDAVPDVPSNENAAADASLRMLLLDVMRELDESTHVALTMSAEGRPHTEIANVLGCDSRTVGRLLRHGRKRCREALLRLGVQFDG